MNKRKILLIGAKGFNRNDEENILKCYEWEKLSQIKNIRDYDVVIINLLDTEDLLDLDIKDTERLFNFQNAYHITKGYGKIIIIGDARKKIPINTDNDLFKDQESDSMPITFFTGINFHWDNSPGNTVIPSYGRREKFIERYVQKLNNWEYSLFSATPNKKVISQVFNLQELEKLDYEIIKDKNSYCRNRYENSLIFSIKLKAIEQNLYSSRDEEITLSNVLLLPKISLNAEATINLVLEDICGLKAPLEEPKWLSEYKAPKQREIDKKIDSIEKEIESNFEKLSEFQEKLKERRRSLKLLFESGEELERVVLDILSELGADIEIPDEKGKEDGWMYVKTGSNKYSGVLEIKGTKKSHFRDKGRKQLLDWVDRGRTLHQNNYKGIFIGNHSIEIDPREREYPYADAWIKSAELSEISAITTSQLFIIYSMFKSNKLNMDRFWEELFTTNGPVNIDQFLESQKN